MQNSCFDSLSSTQLLWHFKFNIYKTLNVYGRWYSAIKICSKRQFETGLLLEKNRMCNEWKCQPYWPHKYLNKWSIICYYSLLALTVLLWIYARHLPKFKPIISTPVCTPLSLLIFTFLHLFLAQVELFCIHLPLHCKLHLHIFSNRICQSLNAENHTKLR